MMEKLINSYVNKLTKQDIVNYINKNNLKVSNNEIDLLYNSINMLG